VVKVRDSVAKLVMAFATSDSELRAIFSGELDPLSAESAKSYVAETGLRILEATLDAGQRDGEDLDADAQAITRVTLQTEPMNGHLMEVGVLRAEGVRAANGKPVTNAESRPFLHGIASIPQTQKPVTRDFPFTSQFNGTIATASCQKDGGVNSSHLIDALGFSFIHVERGGPFNSLKVVGLKHVPGIEKEVERLAPRGLSPHVLWCGGEVQTVDGETRLVDSGFMEGSIMPATPKEFPPPFPITAAELAGDHARSLRAKRFQGVIVRFDEVELRHVSHPRQYRDNVAGPPVRRFRFSDRSKAELHAVALDTVTEHLEPGQRFESLRAIVHQPHAGHYEAIVEMEKHLVS
jgi:hypothetical protein